jgi:hypothetical protein
MFRCMTGLYICCTTDGMQLNKNGAKICAMARIKKINLAQ